MKSDDHDRTALGKLNELIKDISIAMLATQTPDGALRSRPMGTQGAIEDGEVWFFTSDDSGKAGEIAKAHHVNLSYAEPKDQRYVSLSGLAEVVHDRERARQLWKPLLKAWFPAGLDDPHLALLRVKIETAEYWDASASKMVNFFKMAKAAVTGDAPADLGRHEKLGAPALK